MCSHTDSSPEQDRVRGTRQVSYVVDVQRVDADKASAGFNQSLQAAAVKNGFLSK